jgi:hypothetical protein
VSISTWPKYFILIKGSDGNLQTVQAQCSDNGVAAVSVNLATDVYSVTASIVDNGYAAPTGDNAIVVVYDPNGGYVTGGGWIDSQPGALKSLPNATGKAIFGFVSKHLKGAQVPTGIRNSNSSWVH